MVKYDPLNLSGGYLQDENGVYWPIPYRDLRFPPISLWEHREAMKRIRAKGRSAVDEKLLFDSILEQRKILKESRKAMRQRRVSDELRRTGSGSLPSPASTDSTDQDYSHLPPYKAEQW
jgi:putative transposase